MLTPNREPAVQAHTATFDPTTVTLQLPVDCTFDRRVELVDGPINVRCNVRLPACRPVVNSSERSTRIPPAALHTTLLSERQPVDTTELPPTRPRSLNEPSPDPPRPTTVTLCEPVIAAFVTTTPLNDTPSTVIVAVKLLTITVVVVDTKRPVRTPDRALAVILLLDTHCDEVTALPPSRSSTEYRADPAPEPTTVTL